MENLSQEEFDEIKETFAHFDKDGNGSITTDELSKVLRSLGQKPSQQEVNDIISKADKDGTGTVNFSEFLDVMKKDKRCPQKQQNQPKCDKILAAFKKWDKDGNGFITAEELRQALNGMNVNADDKLSEFEALQLVQQADADGDSLIDYNEFVKMMFGD